jgi:hypothetical protein
MNRSTRKTSADAALEAHAKQLPEALKSVFELMYMRGFSYARAAKKLQCTERQVHANYTKARRLIWQYVDKSSPPESTPAEAASLRGRGRVLPPQPDQKSCLPRDPQPPAAFSQKPNIRSLSIISAWKPPTEWEAEGISFSHNLKTGPWTSLLAGVQKKEGREVPLVIRILSVPRDVLGDAGRIARVREDFLHAATLQKELTDQGAKAWVKVFHISDVLENTAYTMEKCEASLQDMYDRKVRLSPRDLFEITVSALQGLEELFHFGKRSHGSLKLSNILHASRDAGDSTYRLSDPSPGGEPDLANDLFSLGLILHQLIELRKAEPLVPLIPSPDWSRLGARKRDWVAFLNLLLSPHGCRHTLDEIRQEAAGLKPGARISQWVHHVLGKDKGI